MAQFALRTGDLTIPARVDSTAFRTSPHTGATLNILNVVIESSNSADQAILEKLAADKPLFEAAFGTAASAKWVLGNTSYRYIGGSALWTYRWELVEKECLRIDELWLQDIRLKPYRYAEEFVGNQLQIHACVKLDPQQRRALTGLAWPFQVVRNGIDDRARDMRFGRSVWSSSGPDEMKAELYVLDYDPTPRLGMMDPLLGNVEGFATFSTVAVNRLLDALREREVLDQATVAGIRDKAESAAADRVFSRAYGVTDLDKWLEATAQDQKYSE